ncbi:unnamed protein product [Mytilus edulis]|uniref:Endonuclease/exonuclease/phosphatase domain-containing protein n=1 Tax=Mytilus edulis TaxID=6550 RepID=A0A8S3PPT2_MYTED|nr:unnamed protein product [Mytilus edulis]
MIKDKLFIEGNIYKPEIKKQSPGEQKTEQSTSLSGTPPTDNRKSQKRARHGLNVCGIKKRLQYPEFIELINRYDIICLQESKTDNCDEIFVPGYISKMKNRHDMTFRKSGGLMVLYKEKLCDHIKFLSSDSNFVIWFEISSSYTKLDAEIAIGSVYIPPENTKYSSPDAFREIETDILKFSTKYKYVCLNGDFNSRTSTDADFIPTDGNDISDILNLPEITENDTYKFEIYNIPIARNNKDKTKNNYGKLLLDLCKFTNMYIINGRIGENMTGERTSKNAAVVDYFIGSLDFINIISNSKVLDFSCLYSDIHSPIYIDVDINKCTCEYGSVPINSMSGEKIKKWDINKKEDFIINLDREKISELQSYLEETKSCPTDSNIFINKAVETITNIFVTSAKKTFGTSKNKSKNENTPQSTRSQDEKPWFNIDLGKLSISPSEPEDN